MLGQVTFLVLTAILGSFALDPLDNRNIGEQGNVTGDPTADVVSAAIAPIKVRFRHARLKLCLEPTHDDHLTLSNCSTSHIPFQPQIWKVDGRHLLNLGNRKCLELKRGGHGLVVVAPCDFNKKTQDWVTEGVAPGATGPIIHKGLRHECLVVHDLDGRVVVVGRECLFSSNDEKTWEMIDIL